MWQKWDINMMKDQEGVKFWFNAESVTEVTVHRTPAQHLEKQGER